MIYRTPYLKELSSASLEDVIYRAEERVAWYLENVGEARDRDLEILQSARTELASR